jgi:hypothetical protein
MSTLNEFRYLVQASYPRPKGDISKSSGPSTRWHLIYQPIQHIQQLDESGYCRVARDILVETRFPLHRGVEYLDTVHVPGKCDGPLESDDIGFGIDFLLWDSKGGVQVGAREGIRSGCCHEGVGGKLRMALKIPILAIVSGLTSDGNGQ